MLLERGYSKQKKKSHFVLKKTRGFQQNKDDLKSDR